MGSWAAWAGAIPRLPWPQLYPACARNRRLAAEIEAGPSTSTFSTPNDHFKRVPPSPSQEIDSVNILLPNPVLEMINIRTLTLKRPPEVAQPYTVPCLHRVNPARPGTTNLVWLHQRTHARTYGDDRDLRRGYSAHLISCIALIATETSCMWSLLCTALVVAVWLILRKRAQQLNCVKVSVSPSHSLHVLLSADSDHQGKKVNESSTLRPTSTSNADLIRTPSHHHTMASTSRLLM